MKTRLIFCMFALLLGITAWCQTQPAASPSADAPPTPHLSDDEHWNYLVFHVRCPKGFKVFNWQAHYDHGALYRGLFHQWVAQTGNPSGITETNYTEMLERVLNNAFGGIQNTNDYETIVNCDGDLVEIHAYMRTRLVSTGFAAEVLRTLEGLPQDTDATVRLYQKNTEIVFSSDTCGK